MLVQGIGKWVGLAALVVLAACGERGDDGGETAGADRPTRAERARATDYEGPFEFLRYAVNEEAARPELCLHFSRALDPAVDYNAYVAVDGPLALKAEGSRLCLGGLSYGQTRTITLREGFPAAGDEALPRDETLTLTFDDRPAVVAFAGDGVILPRIDADGLAVTTVNVDEVDVEISRVDDRALVFKSITSGYAQGANRYSYQPYDERPDDLGMSVWSGRMATGGALNETKTTVFPLADEIGELEPGAYYVRLVDAAALDRGDRRPAEAGRWIIVTDLALTAYRAPEGLDVTVRSLDTATPARGVDVQLVARSNDVLATVESGRDGRLSFDGPLIAGEGNSAPRLLLAYGPGGDFAMLDLDRAPVDLSSEPVSGRRRPGLLDGYLYSDRGIYRPGETIRASFLLRDAAARAVADRPGTLVLTAPNGIEQARHRFEALPQAGGLSHAFELPKAAARGTWTLRAEVDGAGTVARYSVSVEDFVPQRVALELEADTDTPMRAGDTRMIEANARFLYGAPGAGLPVRGTARVQTAPNPFPAWEGFFFGRHDEQFRETQFDLPETVADGRGAARVPVMVGQRGTASSRPLRVRAVVEVEEPGGRAVADDVRIPYRPQDRYVGLKPAFDGRAERDAPVTFEVVTVSADGAAEAARLDWRLVRRDYDYDWYRTNGGDWEWRRSERLVPIETGVVETTADGAVTLETEGLGWGDYTLSLSDNGEILASAGFWVGYGGRTTEGVEAPDQVRVSGADTPPAIGTQTTITLKSPYPGLAEVVVATDRILETRQLRVDAEGAELTLEVTEDWGPGAYVMATVYTPRDPVATPRPRRAVGVAYIATDVSDRTFDLTLSMPEEPVLPGEPAPVVIEAADGVSGTAYLTLAAVDEGILQLTKFESPTPEDWFFGKTAYELGLYDDYGRLLDPNQGAAAPVRQGGDQIGGAGLTVVPTKTVALFEGPVAFDANGRAEVTLDLPDFNGELRVMGVVWSDTALGSVDDALTVRDPVPAELILPRFLAPGDAASATLTVDNVDGMAGDYSLDISTDGPIAAPGGEVTLALAEEERVDRGVALSASGTGIGRVTLEGRGPGGLTFGSDYPIEVRPAFYPETRIERFTLAPGAVFRPDAALTDNFVEGSVDVDVSASLTPLDVTTLLTSLYRYPYACTEQLVSRVMPILQLAGLDGVDLPAGMSAPAEIRDAVETLLSRQSGDGAFGLWRVGDYNASPWLGAYATDFISRAKEAGYPVPDAALSRALDGLSPIARGELYASNGYDVDLPAPQWTTDTRERLTDRSSAYALYVLARNGRADRSRLRYMHDERIGKMESPLARAHIAAGLAAIGDEGRARSGFDAAVDALGYRNRSDWYQTPRRDLAGVMALAAEAGYTDVVERLVPRLLRTVPEPSALTTQEKAFLSLAAGVMAGGQSAPEVSSVAAEEGTLDGLRNDGSRPVYVTALARGVPEQAPPAVTEELSVEKSITDLSGAPVDLGTVNRGDRMIVSLTLTAERRAYASYIIADLLPAGFEIEAVVRPEEAGDTGPYRFLGELAVPDIAEKRDDRFVAALDTRGGVPRRVAYLVRAVTTGDFVLPGAVAEDMYRPQVFARSASSRTRISD